MYNTNTDKENVLTAPCSHKKDAGVFSGTSAICAGEIMLHNTLRFSN